MTQHFSSGVYRLPPFWNIALCVLALMGILSIRACMVGVAQLARAPDCGSGGRGFEPLHPPQ